MVVMMMLVVMMMVFRNPFVAQAGLERRDPTAPSSRALGLKACAALSQLSYCSETRSCCCSGWP